MLVVSDRAYPFLLHLWNYQADELRVGVVFNSNLLMHLSPQGASPEGQVVITLDSKALRFIAACGLR